MHKIIFNKYAYDVWNHPGYKYLKELARQEGWAGTAGLQEMIAEKWGKGTRLYFYLGDINGIGFKSVDNYNDFCYNAGIETQLKLF